jgi:twitching motility protein PilT
MAKIDAFFNLMFEQKASDLHMASGNPPMMRIHGELQRVDYPPLESDALKAMLYEIAPDYKIKQFEETGDVDFGYEIPNISRFRVNFFNQKTASARCSVRFPAACFRSRILKNWKRRCRRCSKNLRCCIAAWSS